jgi:hypothetical protein
MVPIIDVLKIAPRIYKIHRGFDAFRQAASGQDQRDEFFKAFIQFAAEAFPNGREDRTTQWLR